MTTACNVSEVRHFVKSMTLNCLFILGSSLGPSFRQDTGDRGLFSSWKSYTASYTHRTVAHSIDLLDVNSNGNLVLLGTSIVQDSRHDSFSAVTHTWTQPPSLFCIPRREETEGGN